MKVLIDTPIWSTALRRRVAVMTDPIITELQMLISELRTVIIGPIRQEVLCGIQDEKQFENLQKRLRALPDTPLIIDDYERAAAFFNMCRRKGIQGSNTDFLICAAAERLSIPIFTIDKDFSHYQRHLPIQLHQLQS